MAHAKRLTARLMYLFPRQQRRERVLRRVLSSDLVVVLNRVISS